MTLSAALKSNEEYHHLKLYSNEAGLIIGKVEPHWEENLTFDHHSRHLFSERSLLLLDYVKNMQI